MYRKAQRDHLKAHINTKLQRSLRLLLVISMILLGMVVFETVHYHAIIWQISLGILAGILSGIMFARTNKLSWDQDAQHITSRIDKFGVMVLLLYVAFAFSRQDLIQVFTHSEAVPAISFALLTGTMYGRVLGNGIVIKRIMKEQKPFRVEPALPEGI